MTHLQRILFPTDGSACAERARRHAFYLADRFDADVHVVHVDEREVELADVIEIRAADVLSDLHAPLDGDAAVAAPRVQEHEVVHPAAADGLLSYVAEHDIHLVVMGTHGRRGVERLLMGSVAETVVRRAPCPVLTVGRQAVLPDALREGRLLVPVDFSEHQARLLAHARELALSYDMGLTLLHVVADETWPDAYNVTLDTPPPAVLARRAEEALDAPAEALRTHGLDVAVAVRRGHPADEILDAAAEDGADLLAISTHGRTGLRRLLLGSVAETVIRHAACPVFTVKAFGTSLVPSPGA
jgi:nucleotide-binding universal stress UspA family protein